jgi:predicted glutamine amidotransferase
MCFNIVIFNPSKANLSNIFNSIERYARINNDGFSLVSFDPYQYLRTLNLNEYKAILPSVANAKLVHIHFRAGTSGTVTLDNVHMWKVSDFYVSHNGYVGEYSFFYTPYADPTVRWTKNVNSDTYELVHSNKFQELIENRNWRELIKFLNQKHFYGVLLMNNEYEIVAFSRLKPFYIMSYGDMLMFSNTLLSLEKSIKVFGIRLMKTIPYKSIEDQLIVFDTERKRVVERYENKEKYKYIYLNNEQKEQKETCTWNYYDYDYWGERYRYWEY